MPSSKIIPFYGTENQRLFEIERRCMDREQVVVRRLDSVLPDGRVLDIGAGDGFVAGTLTSAHRLVIPMEPARAMMSRREPLPWVQGVAQDLPFRSCAFAAAYATFAYFFPDIGHGAPGLREAHRVVVPGGPIIIVDNAGDDEFTALSEREIASDPSWWAARGFSCQILHTSFRFDSIEEAREYLCFCFGERGLQGARLELTYKVAAYTATSRGAGAD